MKLLARLFLSTVSATACTWLSTANAYSNESVSIAIPDDSSKSCVEAIDAIETELIERGFFEPWQIQYPNRVLPITPEVVTSATDIQNSYYNYPTNRPHSVTFKLSGDSGKLYGLLGSPQLLSIFGARIMADCTQVGLVNFDHWWEGGLPVGYFSNRTARPFAWRDLLFVGGELSLDGLPIRTSQDDRSLYPWGYYHSP